MNEPQLKAYAMVKKAVDSSPLSSRKVYGARGCSSGTRRIVPRPARNRADEPKRPSYVRLAREVCH